MSRRLRVEQKLAEDFEQGIEPEDFYSIQLKRIDKPLVWKRTDGGIKIQDLKEHQFDEVLKIFKNYYMTDDVLCKNSQLLQDEESLNSYLNCLRFQLNDLCSIVAIDENYTIIENKAKSPKEEHVNEIEYHKYDLETETYEMEENFFEEFEMEEVTEQEIEEKKPETEEPVNEKFNESEDEESNEEQLSKTEMPEQVEEKIVGILMLRIIREEDDTRTFSFVQLIDGQAIQKCIELKNYINRKVDIFKVMKCDVFLRYYEMCVLPEYKNRRIDYLLMFSALSVAHSFKIPVVGGLFPNYSTQRIAKAIGMQILNEVKYTSWKDEHGELVFEDPGPGNYSCALMAGEVPPLPPPPLPPKASEDELQDTSTLPRYHKQRLLAKKRKKEQEELDKDKEKQAEKQREMERKLENAAVKAEAQNEQHL